MAVEDASSSVYVDHHNGITLDDQRTNLRRCDNKHNQGNRRMQGGTSRYRGVTWYSRRKKWMARIRVNWEQLYLGSFQEERDAASVYNAVAKATLENLLD
jgi:hypothetical protein